MGIAYRRALRALRDERNKVTFEHEQLHEDNCGSHDSGEAATMQDWVATGLRQLPDEQRLTLELAYFMGHSCEEIAVICACPVGTVKARMFHAREKLRRALPSLGGSPTSSAS
jgi:RNA polymerase sigma-70 factor (ECF subfamily)